MDSSTAKKRIVILGGGFAGVEAARYLDRTAAKCGDVEVTLVSIENLTMFTSRLHEVASGDLEPNHICKPLRKLLRRVVVLNGNVGSIALS
jgi:NADH dehydrogenase